MADAGSVSTSTTRGPIWLYVLAVYSLLLGIITGIPEAYYALYGLHLVPIGPHTNPLGEIWNWFNNNGENGYVPAESGFWAGAVLDGLVLGPLYILSGIWLWQRRRWVIPVGLCAGSMLFYGTMLLVLSDLFSHLHAVANELTYWLSNAPYLIYSVWIVYTMIAQRKLFTR